MRAFLFLLFLTTSGCASLPLHGTAPESVRMLVRQSEADLRALLADLDHPAALPDYAAALGGLESARIALLTQSLLALDNGLEAQAGLAAAGVTLKLCHDRVARMATASREDARAMAQTDLRLACLAPLAILGS